MITSKQKKSWMAIAIVLAIGAVLAWAVLQRDQPAVGGDAHSHDEAEHHDAGEQEEAHVTMSDVQLQQAGITLATAGPARIASHVSLLGEVRYNGDRTVQVVPRLSGLVTSVSANAGDRVRKGQVLAVLSSSALSDLRAESAALQQRLRLAQSTFAREKKLWEEKISPEQDYLQAGAAFQDVQIAAQSVRQKLINLGGSSTPHGLDLSRFELRSPIDGVITDKRIATGQFLGENETVFTISDLSSVWVDITVAPKDLGVISKDQTAQVHATSTGTKADGVVAYVSALVSEQSRSAMARIVLPNPQGIWRPGLPVQVSVTTTQTEVAVAVQAQAIQSLRDGPVVFERSGSQLEAKPLTLGRSDGAFVEVVSGLNAGERYAAKNSFVIKAELGKAGASHDH